MSDYLGNLAARSLEPAAAVRPRLASRFEPVPSAVPQFQAEPVFFEETVEKTAAEPAHATVLSPSPPGRRGQGMRPRREERPEAEEIPKAASEGPEPEWPTARVGPLVVVDSGRPATRSGLPFEASSPSPFSRGEKGKQEAVTPVVLPVPEVRVVEKPVVRTAHPTERVFDTPFPFSPREKGSGDEASKGTPPEPPPSSKREAPASFLQPRITLPEPFPVRHEAPAPETVIHVSIGRIEVRATQAPKAPSRERPAAARTGVDLEDYLRQRSKGEGR